MKPRWEGDERGYGVGNARAFAGAIGELLDAASLRDWVAEAPDVHLLPHLEAVCGQPGSRFTLESTSVNAAGELVVAVRWDGERDAVGQIRQAIFALLGAIAEPATYVRQRRAPASGGHETLTFEVVTGILPGDGPLAPHGHTIIFRVESESP